MQSNTTEQIFQVALPLSQDEADALLHLLLCAPETDEVSEEMTAHLLRRIVEVQRSFLQSAHLADKVESKHEKRCNALCPLSQSS